MIKSNQFRHEMINYNLGHLTNVLNKAKVFVCGIADTGDVDKGLYKEVYDYMAEILDLAADIMNLVRDMETPNDDT